MTTQLTSDLLGTGPLVLVVDDDASVRDALSGLFQSVGIRSRVYDSCTTLLSDKDLDEVACMVLDVRLPGQSGLDFHDALIRKGVRCPVVFISGHADVPMAVRAMKAGAVEVLTKPVSGQNLLDAVHSAIEQDRARRAGTRRLAEVSAGFDGLTRREREIMALVVAGRRNKQIAAEIGLSEATVKLHRGRVMQKMNASSVAELVRMADALATART